MSRGSDVALIAVAYSRDEYLYAENLGLRYLTATLREAGYSVGLYEDLDVHELSESQALELSIVPIIGITALFTKQLPDVIALANKLKQLNPNCHLIIGGQGISFQWARLLEDCPSIDSVCMYEADETLPEVVHKVLTRSSLMSVAGIGIRRSDGSVKLTPRDPPADLDNIPFPHRNGEPGTSHYTVLSSRGCMAHCTFCQSGNYGNRYHSQPKWRARSAANVLEEVGTLVDAMGAKAISFVDDDFLGGDSQGFERAAEIAEGLIRLRKPIAWSIECRINEVDRDLFALMQRAGLRHVLIGIESGNEEDLRVYAKKTTNSEALEAIRILRSLDIQASYGFIMFNPLTTPEKVRDNLDFIREAQIGDTSRITNRLELYPGAPLLRYYQFRGIEFREESHRLYYEFKDPNIATYYEHLKTVLSPLADVESTLLRRLFEVDTQGGQTAAQARTRLKQSLVNLSGSITDAAERLLEEVLSGRGGQESQAYAEAQARCIIEVVDE